MTSEEYIINRLQQLEKEAKYNTDLLLKANDKANLLEKSNIKLLDMIDFLIDKLHITYDIRNDLINVGANTALVPRDLAEYFKYRNDIKNDGWSPLEENAYRLWKHNGLSEKCKNPAMDKVVKDNE